MTFEAFFAAIFELVSLWVPATESAGEEQYACFLQGVFDWIAMPTVGGSGTGEEAGGQGHVPVYDIALGGEESVLAGAVRIGGVRCVPNFRMRPLEEVGSMLTPDGQLAIELPAPPPTLDPPAPAAVAGRRPRAALSSSPGAQAEARAAAQLAAVRASLAPLTPHGFFGGHAFLRRRSGDARADHRGGRPSSAGACVGGVHSAMLAMASSHIERTQQELRRQRRRRRRRRGGGVTGAAAASALSASVPSLGGSREVRQPGRSQAAGRGGRSRPGSGSSSGGGGGGGAGELRYAGGGGGGGGVPGALTASRVRGAGGRCALVDGTWVDSRRSEVVAWDQAAMGAGGLLRRGVPLAPPPQAAVSGALYGGGGGAQLLSSPGGGGAGELRYAQLLPSSGGGGANDTNQGAAAAARLARSWADSGDAQAAALQMAQRRPRSAGSALPWGAAPGSPGWLELVMQAAAAAEAAGAAAPSITRGVARLSRRRRRINRPAGQHSANALDLAAAAATTDTVPHGGGQQQQQAHWRRLSVALPRTRTASEAVVHPRARRSGASPPLSIY
jgi:hypothetical protein